MLFLQVQRFDCYLQTVARSGHIYISIGEIVKYPFDAVNPKRATVKISTVNVHEIYTNYDVLIYLLDCGERISAVCDYHVK